jgi:hypothetical protein
MMHRLLSAKASRPFLEPLIRGEDYPAFRRLLGVDLPETHSEFTKLTIRLFTFKPTRDRPHPSSIVPTTLAAALARIPRNRRQFANRRAIAVAGKLVLVMP